MPGSLFVVATPIGNLEDITLRALRTLKEVHVIAAEDTRRTAKLLAHYDIQKPMVSLREHNEVREAARLVERMIRGESIALVSDAGTPTVSDPGTHLIGVARKAGVPIVPIPGPSAVVTALSGSGYPADRFTFLGFPPPSGQERDEWFEILWKTPSTVVFFEAPHRIERTLDQLGKLVERPIIVCRELTKINEELVIWDIKLAVKPLGEFVVVVGPASHHGDAEVDDAQAARIFGQIKESTKLEEEDVLAMVASHLKISPSKARKHVKKGSIRLKREAETQ